MSLSGAGQHYTLATMSSPRLSVIIAAYNEAATIT
jgi:hypothetical protein